MTSRCGWCTALGREAWERRVLNGEPLALVARDTPFSSSAAQRHMRQHVHSVQLAEMRTSAASTLHVQDFADRLVALANEAAEIRASSKDTRSKLRAVREERDSLAVLLTRLGIDAEEGIDALREAKALAQAVSAVLRDHPDVAAELAEECTTRGELDLAAAFGRLVSAGQLRAVNGGSSTRELVS